MGRGSVVSNLSVRLCVRVWGAGTVALSDRPAVDFRFDYMTKYLVSKTASIRECGHITVHYSFYDTIRYDTIRDAILTCARKPTRVSLIYRTELFLSFFCIKKLQIRCSMPNPPPDHERSVLKAPENSDLDHFVVFMPKRRYDEPVNVIFVTESHIVG